MPTKPYDIHFQFMYNLFSYKHVDFLAKYLYTKHELGFLQKCFQYLKIVCLESMLSTKNRLNAHFQKKNVRIKSINSYILSRKKRYITFLVFIHTYLR